MQSHGSKENTLLYYLNLGNSSSDDIDITNGLKENVTADNLFNFIYITFLSLDSFASYAVKRPEYLNA
jgi:hypothetical protein